jgi:hypothetical protein
MVEGFISITNTCIIEMYYHLQGVWMGGACSTHLKDEKCLQNIEGKRPFEDLEVDGKILLEWMLGT